jgi:arylsulfatase A
VTQPVHPEVVVVICDDLGRGDVAINAPSPIRTPHLHTSAAGGTVFTAMCSGGPTCTPARAAL